MKKLIVSLFALGVVVLIGAAVSPRASAADEKVDAKALFVETHKCSICHSVADADISAKTKSEKLKGPDMSGFKSDHSLAEIAAYARKEADLDGKTHKKEFKGSDEELQAIIDWLGSLEAQKTE